MPMLLIDRSQPMVRGFAYGGKVQTHQTCNNHFRPEKFGRKALQLLRALYDEDSIKVITSQSQPNIAAYAINSQFFSNFTSDDIKFFRFTRVNAKIAAEDIDPANYFRSNDVNPLKFALSTSLSVLAKSAAALLLNGHLQHLPQRWAIFALPFLANLSHQDIESVFPGRAPYDTEVSVWIDPIGDGDYTVVFRAHGIFVIFLFQFSLLAELVAAVRKRFPSADCVAFSGTALMDLVGYEWQKI